MNERHQRDLLHYAAQRAEQRHFFVASALAAYRKLHGMNETDLATFLDCAPAVLPRLALCRLPDTATAQFRPDVERIATYTGVNSLHLARLLREVEATTALQRLPQTPEHGFLLAARDRPHDPDAVEAPEREAAHETETDTR
jgi:hypothetical protein